MRTVHRLSPTLFLLLACFPAAQAVTIEQIHSPRPAGWVVDLTATLSPEIQGELNRLSNAVKAQTGAEMTVVVVDTTEGVPSRQFATRLFNTWRIGQRRKDNGLLVFAALTDHKAEIILGRGISDPARVRESQEVMDTEMVPRFRSGDPAGAIFHGAAACAGRILGADVAVQEPAAVTPAPEETPAAAVTPAPASPPPSVPAYIPDSPPSRKESVDPLVYGGIGGALLLIGGVAALMLRPVRCPRCKEKMKAVAAGDADLGPSEQVEQRIGSVDYQIWVCPACGERKKTSRQRFFSGYKTCPSCSARTLESTKTTVEEATYTHDGLVQVEDRCLSCSYHDSRSYSTPMLVRSSSYSSSSSSSVSFSSSDSGSGGGSNSSSDSGFGGGSSSGDGASGSW
jgi:uncharacterized protein